MRAIRPVSDAVAGRLAVYAEQLRLWQRKTNLVAPSTLDSLWHRHFLDSWQILPLLPEPDGRAVVDLGSGGGFPGLVLAMAGCNPVHLVEANGKKAGFLRYVAAQTGTDVTIHACRIEDPALSGLAPVAAVTARACAALQQLLAWAAPLVDPDSRLVFLKGQSWREEIAAAERDWAFAWSATPSVTDPEAAIVTVTALEPRRPHALA
ncbi:MAG: 16S rRNA (guanine(527)-N(7))-methyltransferase RsmG [Alphaproteobacteria bacterium]|nr:16S rRNA (guanine(527)-N(7))-methyltransferase RsmG [Alphaproteobacteria bacterium]